MLGPIADPDTLTLSEASMTTRIQRKCGAPVQDLTQQRFGRLVVLGLAGHKASDGKLAWTCRCDCGNVKNISGGCLRYGASRSCGCLRMECRKATGKQNATHGMKGTPEYRAWCGMKNRCYNKNHDSYPWYGGRGIAVCESWLGSFEAFYADMGPKPSPQHSVERSNLNGNYEPGNAIWGTEEEQANNRPDSRLITVGDETMTVARWSRRAGMSPARIYQRLDRGWSAADAVTIPVGSRRTPSEQP